MGGEGVCNMDAKMQILQSFQSQLCKSLDNEQVTRVCRILDVILDEYSICKTQKTESKLDLLLEDLIQAKKLEGCSEKTLGYYKSTLDKLFKSTNKSAAEITSEDIRKYLSNFQTH